MIEEGVATQSNVKIVECIGIVVALFASSVSIHVKYVVSDSKAISRWFG